MLSFAYLWLFCLLPLPWLVGRGLPARVRREPALLVPFLHRVRQAAGGESATSPHDPMFTRVAQWGCWCFIVLALARPQWVEAPIEKQIPTRDLLLLVDLSGSMDAEDFTDRAGKSVDRLTAVKEVAGEFLLRREGDRVGLVVFGSSPFLQAPFTTDLELCRLMLEESAVRMAGPSTALGDAIGLGIHQFEESDAPEKTIIALTDGNDTSSALPPAEAAKVARDRGVTIHTIAMGDPETIGEEKLDEAALREVARVAGGRYFLAMNREELEQIYTELDEIETREIQTVSHRPRRDLYYWPLGVALFCSLLASVIEVLQKRTAHASGSDGMRLRVNVHSAELELRE